MTRGNTAAIERAPVDLLVLALLMPNIEGYKVLARLRSNEKDARIPVAVVPGATLCKIRV